MRVAYSGYEGRVRGQDTRLVYPEYESCIFKALITVTIYILGTNNNLPPPKKTTPLALPLPS